MSSPVRCPSIKTPFLEGAPASIVSKEWYRVLLNISEALGGPAGTNNAADIALLEAIDSGNTAERATLSQRIDTLNVAVEMLNDCTAEVTRVRSMIEDLSIALVMLQDTQAMIATGTQQLVRQYGPLFTGFTDYLAITNPDPPPAGVVRHHASTTQGFTRLEQDNEATTNLVLGRDHCPEHERRSDRPRFAHLCHWLDG
jgi:TolA-binding protein